MTLGNLSLRTRLVLILLAGIVVLTALTIVWTSLLARSELAEVYDRNMEQLALSLDAQYDTSLAPGAGAPRHQPPWNDPDSEFVVQIRALSGKLLYASNPDLGFQSPQKSGYGYTDFRSHRWRYFNYLGPHLKVQVYQPDAPRRQTIMAILERFLIPSLLELPVLGLVIWFSVSLGLRPLRKLTADIQARGANYLSPVPESSLPADVRPVAMALNRLFQRLDKALVLQRRFTADAAHELRTPLAAVQIQLDMVKRARNPGEHAEALDALTEGVRRCTHVVRQLLAMARHERDAGFPAKTTVNAMGLLEEVGRRLRPLADERRVVLRMSGASENAAVSGVWDELTVLFENLLDNAIRFTPEGGAIDICLEARPGGPVVTISDTGPGIPAEHRGKIFDRFYRGEGGATTGTGLGLAIAKAIADRHSAEIRLGDGMENQQGSKGLAVSVHFAAHKQA